MTFGAENAGVGSNVVSKQTIGSAGQQVRIHTPCIAWYLVFRGKHVRPKTTGLVMVSVRLRCTELLQPAVCSS